MRSVNRQMLFSEPSKGTQAHPCIQRFSTAALVLSLLLLQACISPPAQNSMFQKRDVNNMAFLYDPTAVSLHPECAVWHNGDSLSTLYIGIPASELLFNQANQKGEFLTKLRFKFELYKLNPERQGRQLVDSASYLYNLQRDRLHNYFFTTIIISTRPGEKYNLRLITYDLMRKKSNQSFVYIDRSQKISAQSFMAFSPSGQLPVMRNWVNEGRRFSLRVYPAIFPEVRVDYYANRQPLPRPLFSLESLGNVNLYPDSSWMMPMSDTLQFLMSRPGLYHFRVDTNQQEGFTMLSPGIEFPETTSPESLIDPLAYLTNSNEQRELLLSDNKKMAVDNFWRSCASNLQVSKEIIKVYYNRVRLANLYFTCDREGWKTDRGMIYIVYGPPGSLYKNDDTEEWVYYPAPGRKINFIFKHEENKFSRNYYLLQRNLDASTYWRQAVDSWRNGKIFLLD